MSTAKAQGKFGRNLAPSLDRAVAEPSNRRFRTWSGVNTAAKTFDLETAGKAVEAACKNALALWPNAKAAILFGSRARGDHRTNSDWDIAFITSTEESLPSTVHRDLNELNTSKRIFVHGLAISQKNFYDKANSLGNIAASIAREGRLISGRCNWPETESKLIMEPNEYASSREMALRHISSAAVNFAKGIDNARINNESSAFKFFVKETSNAAERFAKIVFDKLASGTDEKYTYSHTVDTIVQDIDKIFEKNMYNLDKDSKRRFAEKAEWWRSEQGREFCDMLSKMNGHGHGDHLYGYEVPAPNGEMIARAANRLVATACFAIREVEELPGPAGLREVAIKVADSHRSDLLESASLLRRILQNLELNDSTFSAAGPTLARSAAVAAEFGEEIAEVIERLANSRYAESASGDRADSAP